MFRLRGGGRPRPATRLRIRKDLWNAQKRCCHYCRTALSLKKATLDHVIPQSKGGSWRKMNLVVACFPCNNRRGDMEYNEFLALVKGSG